MVCSNYCCPFFEILLIKRRMGFVFSGMTGGFLVSPFLAGIVYDKAGYFPVFAMINAVLTTDLLLRATMIEKRSAEQWDNSRRSSSGSFTNSVEESLGSEQVKGTTIERLPLCDTSQAAMSPIEGSKSQSSGSWFMRQFPTTTIIFRSPRLMTAVFGIFVYMTITASFDGALAQFVKRTFDFDSSRVGLIFIALSTPALFGTAYGILSDRCGPRHIALAGFATAALGLALSVVIYHKSTAQIAGLSILLVLIGKCARFPPCFFGGRNYSRCPIQYDAHGLRNWAQSDPHTAFRRHVLRGCYLGGG